MTIDLNTLCPPDSNIPYARMECFQAFNAAISYCDLEVFKSLVDD